jgi:radical SAM protein with 4Fe4S-binding SPASM domain
MLFLQSAVLEVSGRCNLRCRHCYGPFTKDSATSAHALRWSELLDELESLGCTEVCLSGGEPLLEPGLVNDLARRAKSKGMAVVLTTNGLLAPEMRVDFFAHFDLVQVSIDGTVKTHDRMRGRGSFARAVAGTREIRRRHPDKAVRLMMTLTEENVASVPAVFELAQELGCGLGMERVCGVGNASGNLVLSKENFRAALDFAVANGVYVNDPLVALLPGHPLPLHSCSAGAGAVVVSSEFDCFPCTKIRKSMGSVAENPLADVLQYWEISPRLDDPASLKGRCARCSHALDCGGCRAMSWAVSGDLFGEDPMCWRDELKQECL